MDTGQGDMVKPQRWSAKQKRDVVLRLLRGERVNVVSDEIGVPIHQLERWRVQFLEAGRAGLRMRTQAGRGGGGRSGRAEIAELKARIHLLERALRLAAPGANLFPAESLHRDPELHG